MSGPTGWRDRVEIPVEWLGKDRTVCLLRALADLQHDIVLGDSLTGTGDLRPLLGKIVALAEQGSDGHADLSDLAEPPGSTVLGLLPDIVWGGDIDWMWVRDYCAAWLRELCKEREEGT